MLQGAIVLANTIPFMPVGVHLAVIDPGVGSGRRGIALRDAEGRLYVGPDNGLLVPAAEKQGGVTAAWDLTNPEYQLSPVSHTFHGRDVFAPAAAHLANGSEPGRLGEELDPATLLRIALPAPEFGETRIRARVLYVDRYGNVQLNLDRDDVDRVGIAPGCRVELDVGLDSLLRDRRAHLRRRAGRATSSSTRTRTGTSPSRSPTATRPRCSPSPPASS